MFIITRYTSPLPKLTLRGLSSICVVQVELDGVMALQNLTNVRKTMTFY